VSAYQEQLALPLPALARSEQSLANPLFRFLEREITVVNQLVRLILKQLGQVKDMAEGVTLPSNEVKALAVELHSDTVPKSWFKFTFDTSLKASQFIADLRKRLEQFNRLVVRADYERHGVWFGGLLFPEAFMTATRQQTAQRNLWSLEELELAIRCEAKPGSLAEEEFLLTGFAVEGASFRDNVLQPLTEHEPLHQRLPPLVCRWVRKAADLDRIQLPVYLNTARKNIVMSILLHKSCSSIELYQKGICLLAWNP
jgi:dynein heavy chain 1